MWYSDLLTDKHIAAGLYLDESDDHLLLLKSPRKVEAAFSQYGASPVKILEAADDYLLEIDAQ